MAGCTLTGVVLDPVHARASRTPQDVFVNRRPVRNAAVAHAVFDGYGALLPKSHHPTYVLFLDIDPERVDVNVHPAKREIRFADQEAVHRFVRQTVRHALSGVERKLVLGMAGEAGPETKPHAFQASASPSNPMLASKPESLFASERAGVYAASPDVAIIPFGQVLQTYLVAQVGHELHVIDQHTAHERVLFQRLWRTWMQRDMAVQPLLIPEPVELTVAETTLIQKYVAEFEQLGLVVEVFGASAVLLRGVPAGWRLAHS
jgi:DNA mismatch repair protein MutL